ncbi:hypothetical protein KJY77_06475 [Canibacter sp. lx-72]|uniref:hypothetical protein n=1 Tax=Canibacter zhuwentaonis TaxID=2837491 RepID=UPI001BDC06AD|nr:hypothetical protein [Canibacter zhuwentaonis]MBT1018775.1 hypothetical protein [Canibacter zhuwentaonis]
MTTKSVVAIAQLLFLTLAFAGGMLLSPAIMPERLNDLSLLLPSRATRDLICDLGVGNSLDNATIIGLLVWTGVFAIANFAAAKISKK